MLSKPRISGVFFCPEFLLSLGIVQKLLQLQSFTFLPKLFQVNLGQSLQLIDAGDRATSAHPFSPACVVCLVLGRLA